MLGTVEPPTEDLFEDGVIAAATTACTASAHAVAEALRLIRAGDAEVVISAAAQGDRSGPRAELIGNATRIGDLAEAKNIRAVFRRGPAVSKLDERRHGVSPRQRRCGRSGGNSARASPRATASDENPGRADSKCDLNDRAQYCGGEIRGDHAVQLLRVRQAQRQPVLRPPSTRRRRSAQILSRRPEVAPYLLPNQGIRYWVGTCISRRASRRSKGVQRKQAPAPSQRRAKIRSGSDRPVANPY